MATEARDSTEKAARYFHREHSWLAFNARVLAEAEDETNPLLERVKFSGIVTSNFEEFFMVRLPALLSNESQAKRVYAEAFALMNRQRANFSKVLCPQLEKAGIRRVQPQALNDKQLEHLRKQYRQEIAPLLTPVALHEGQAVPFLVNLSVYCLFQLVDPDAPAAKRYAVVELPKNHARNISLPAESGYEFVLLEDVLALFAQDLFPGFEITGRGVFRLIRASEMTVDEEKDEDFAKVISEALRTRLNSPVMCLIVDASEDIVAFLQRALDVPPQRTYQAGAWVDLKGVAELAFLPAYSGLKYKNFIPVQPRAFEDGEDVWKVVTKRDVLVHHPYESFDCFLRFLDAAAGDKDVLVIKQTLYRAAEPSAVIARLEKAAKLGKQVTVLVELKARFDEQRNIEWATRLRNAGATVIYGVAGLKTHAKACLVVRRETEGIRRYVHLSTGNYNEKTSKLYTDMGLFSANEQLTVDVAAFFNVVTGYSHPVGFSKIEVAPFTLRQRLKGLILREAMRARAGGRGLIIAKMNSLVDAKIIDLLYAASQDGVKILLNIRGICRLRPGVKGLSENIEVISIVDMFLEHSRIFYFLNDGEEEVFLSSADWMPRNLDRRLEIMFPVEEPQLRQQIVELLHLYFRDNVKSWKLLPNGQYEKLQAGTDKPFRVQEHLARRYTAEGEKRKLNPILHELKPKRPKHDGSANP